MKGGLYLIVDPSQNEILPKLRRALEAKVTAVQVWDNWQGIPDWQVLLHQICSICKLKQVPILINNRWELLATHHFDGVHFDEIPQDFNEIREQVKREIIVGITCDNNLEKVRWAEENRLEYISFCSMFPSVTANSCELINPETVQRAREITSIPIFLAGGIRPDNLSLLSGLGHFGVAVVSGIMNHDDPQVAVNEYLSYLNQA